MTVKEGFTDFMVVDEEGRIEYFYIPVPDYYDFRPEELIGTFPQQQYNNLDDDDSTLMLAVTRGTTTKDYPQELITLEGNRVRQVSDTYCIKKEGKVIGAIEFAYYDKEYAGREKKKHKEQKKKRPVAIEDIIGSSESMKEFKRKLGKVVNLESPIILVGETGTGKEMAARAIHNASRRREGEFVYVNCGALPENLLEGILFGIKRGSFTDAEEREGLFEVADGGTIFLDEINAMPLATQGKILRAIEEKRIRPVGGEEEISVDVRIIASYNGRVDTLLNHKGMRKDLYFRLAVIQLELPPLRKRGKDIAELAAHFIDELNREPSGKGIKGMDREAAGFFERRDWPGNVRELKNTIEGAYYSAEGDRLRFADIKERFMQRAEAGSEAAQVADDFFRSGLAMKEYMDAAAEKYIKNALKAHGGALRDTAKALGLTTQMLRYNMEKYGIQRP